MRSRTELVTTTFIDSEEEQTESDDSEEDWRPESSRNGKKRQTSTRGKRRNKRKAATASRLLAKKRMVDNMKDEESDEGSYQKIYPPTETNQLNEEQRAQPKKLDEKSSTDNDGVFSLYLYKKDLDEDYKNNWHLCLWRRDKSCLLQKYIRIKTSNCEEFLFTSSSVYSSWDERRHKEFATVFVKCLEDNNRRVIIQEPECLQSMAEEAIRTKPFKMDHHTKGEDDSDNEMLDSQEEEGDYGEEDDEEISGEDDMNSAKTSDGENEYSGEEEGSTNEGASQS